MYPIEVFPLEIYLYMNRYTTVRKSHFRAGIFPGFAHVTLYISIAPERITPVNNQLSRKEPAI